ncbi:response regulator [Candidatus Magnetominusculus xianensis]|uniref:Transcriptional regulator n=1 Tax=Candidatus Magnetominusculus xianensis TaxID=1748249 RepID=A0ABR5SC30_9BACT|nr:response regulator [Candidatus Magnetominusculus xianensis]KWT78987.1 transcriptional regulator [Candidatus Magnetominusculus xianensis]MBF0405006.1 response regulator [Nitrospirota bacterium]
MKQIDVLLADDEKDFVEVLSRRMRTRGFKVNIAFDGQEAIEYIKERIPDVLLLDMKMPRKNGIDVLRWLNTKKIELPALVLTGYSSVTEEEEAWKLGVFDILRKPPEMDILSKAVKEAYIKKGTVRK